MQFYSVALNKRLFSAPVHAGHACRPIVANINVLFLIFFMFFFIHFVALERFG